MSPNQLCAARDCLAARFACLCRMTKKRGCFEHQKGADDDGEVALMDIKELCTSIRANIHSSNHGRMGCGSAVLKEILQNKYEIQQLKFWGNIWLLQAFLNEVLLDLNILH
jgi:hypothetical protein